jgi:hypothetical protein
MIRMERTGFIIMLAILAVTWSSCRNGGSVSVTGDAGIVFDTIVYDFGVVPYGSKAETEFVFTNSGAAPLLVSRVKSTCGCTIPEWSRQPVKPGKRGSVRVSYDTHRIGAFNKSIYVYSNAKNGVQRLMISGKVNPSDT